MTVRASACRAVPTWRAPSTCRCSGFVLGLGLIVRALADHGLGDLVTDILPGGDGLLALLGAAALAAVLANLLNNVPALLVLLPAAAAARARRRCSRC